MSTPNFRTQEDFPLYIKDDSEFYARFCPDCGTLNDTDAEDCEECGAELPDPSFDELECQVFFEDVRDALTGVNDRLRFFKIHVMGGYYSGAQFYVEEIEDSPHDLDNDDCRYTWDLCRSAAIRKRDAEQRRVCRELSKLAGAWGFEKYICGGIFSNGEAIYYKVRTAAACAPLPPAAAAITIGCVRAVA